MVAFSLEQPQLTQFSGDHEGPNGNWLKFDGETHCLDNCRNSILFLRSFDKEGVQIEPTVEDMKTVGIAMQLHNSRMAAMIGFTAIIIEAPHLRV